MLDIPSISSGSLQGDPMSSLTLTSANNVPFHQPSAQWAHDIRNTLATVGLYLETLQRLSGSRGREVADAAQAMMSRAAAMCNEAVVQAAQRDIESRRSNFDVVKVIVQVANLLRPATPEGFEIRVAGSGAFPVLANPQDVFRILFNLVNNAITVARHGGQMTSLTLLIERVGINVAVRIADDGPGLPKSVRASLFRTRPGRSPTEGNGLGLAIARELTERNGGVLELAESARGTTFLLQLPGAARVHEAERGAMCSLGKRTPH